MPTDAAAIMFLGRLVNLQLARRLEGFGCQPIPDPMSPTLFREGEFRFYFFSREERPIHIDVHAPKGEAKFWLEPRIELALNYGLNVRQINRALRIIQEHEDEIREAWQAHFGG